MGHEGPIRIGMIGYGRAVVQQHGPELEPLRDKFQVVAVCARNSERQALARDRYHCATYGDYGNLLKDPNVELVDITTPSVDHTPMAIAALDAGKHVYLEKPVSTSYHEAQALQAASNRYPGKLLVRHNRRFFGDFVRVKEIIDSGQIGEVFLIRVRCMKYDVRDDWQTLKERGGGILLNVGPHFIDHCLAFLGWKYESLWAGSNLIAARGDAEDHAKVIFRGNSGLVVDLEMSGAAAFDEVSYSAYGKHGAVACDGKTIRVKYYDPGKVACRPARAGSPDANAPFGSGIAIPWIEETIPVGPPQRDLWDEIYKSIREGGEFPITVEQAVLGMKVIEDVKSMTKN